MSPHTAETHQTLPRRIALRSAVAYWIFGSLWIVVSDLLRSAADGRPAYSALPDMLKGLLFVLGSSLLLYVLVRRQVLALQRSEQRLRLMVENLPAGAIHVEGDTVLLNRATERLTGYSRDELTTLESWGRALHGERYDEFRALYEDDRRQGFPAPRTVPVRRKDGEVRHVKFTAYAYEQGEVWLLNDVTEQRKAEEALRAAARQQAAVAELGQMALAGTPPVELMNRMVGTICQVLGVRYCLVLERSPEGRHLVARCGTGWREAVSGCTVAEADDSSYGSYALWAREPLIVTDFTRESRFPTPTLLVEHGVISGMSVTIPGEDTAIGLLGAYADEARPFSEDEAYFLQAMANVLATAMQRKAAEEAMTRQKEELARSNDELEKFAYVASHDLQEPLRMVSSYTQLLARRYQGRLDEDADEFIGYAVDGATQMQSLINDLLAYSRVGSRGREFTPISCEEVLERALTNLKLTIEDNGATISHDPLPTVTADASQMVQLLQNLIGNAIKFKGQSPPRVHLSAQVESGEWVFCVQDNGIGIDPQFAERIFVVFQRLHSRVDYPGTGIGLAICKRIVERHGGRIWVDSKPETGSRFYFTIPADRRGRT